MDDELNNLLPVLRQALSARAYATVDVRSGSDSERFALCDGRLVLDDDDDGSATIARIAALLETEHCVATLEPLLHIPEAHSASSLDTTAAIREAVRQMAIASQLRRGLQATGEMEINLSDEERRPPGRTVVEPATSTDQPLDLVGDRSSTEADRRSQADRMREEFFARRRPLNRPTSGGPSYRSAAAPDRSISSPPARSITKPVPQPDRRVIDQIERTLISAADRAQTAAPPMTPVDESGGPTRRGALRSLIRSLVE